MVVFTWQQFKFIQNKFLVFHLKCIVLFISFALVCVITNAQTFQKGDTIQNDNSENTIGFKKLSKTSENSLKSSTDEQLINNTNENHASEKTNESRVVPSEIIFLDYSRMPYEVQKKIDSNKINNKSLLDGIEKVFRVEIKSCVNEDEARKILVFLENEKGFIKFELVSLGSLNIYVKCFFDGDHLHDLMVDKGIEYNFLGEYYFVKN